MKMSKISFLSGFLLFILIIPFCEGQLQCEEECDRCLLCICPASGGCPEYFECLAGCPLVADLKGDGFRFGGPDSSVAFDLLGNGLPDKYQWVLPDGDDGFLAMDLNQNGRVDNGAELFGNGTEILKDGSRAVNGFAALSQFDTIEAGGNEDGFINPEDGIWPFLFIWLDLNADGISHESEMIPIDDTGIAQFSVITWEEPENFDPHRNWLRYWAQLRVLDQNEIQERPFLDVYLLKIQKVGI